jgi:hypothetical protein
MYIAFVDNSVAPPVVVVFEKDKQFDIKPTLAPYLIQAAFNATCLEIEIDTSTSNPPAWKITDVKIPANPQFKPGVP